VLSANSFINTPSGVTVSSGRVTDIVVLAALFTRSLGYDFWHFLAASGSVTKWIADYRRAHRQISQKVQVPRVIGMRGRVLAVFAFLSN
jgi:cytochrome bd-type quinol oxidase subunit 1